MGGLTAICALAACGGPWEASESDFQQTVPEITVGPQGAWFKLSTRNPDILVENLEKCFVPAGTRLLISGGVANAEQGHLRVTLAASRSDCEFRTGYFESAALLPVSGDVTPVPPPTPVPTPPPLPTPPPIPPPTVIPVPTTTPVVQPHGTIPRKSAKGAFLSVIAFAEGTNERYDLLFGFETFSDYSKHPERKVCRQVSGRELCSSAAGRYQILFKTWNTLVQPALRLPDFSPASQDKAGLFLVENRGVRLTDAYFTEYQDFARAVTKLNQEWASLPDSPHGQPTRKMGTLWEKYSEFIK